MGVLEFGWDGTWEVDTGVTVVLVVQCDVGRCLVGAVVSVENGSHYFLKHHSHHVFHGCLELYHHLCGLLILFFK